MVKLEEQREELQRRELAEASRRRLTAEEVVARARGLARSDERRQAAAADWQLAELAHLRALSELRVAEQALSSAAAESEASRARYTAAYSRAESLRRLAATRAADILQERDKAERKELDELAILRRPPREAA